jgi:UDP-N-acetylmuramoylalanine--D-glutamate ligase
LLAPACASFDQFENYEQRGRIFKDLIRRLQSNVTEAAAQSPAASSPTRQ